MSSLILQVPDDESQEGSDIEADMQSQQKVTYQASSPDEVNHITCAVENMSCIKECSQVTKFHPSPKFGPMLFCIREKILVQIVRNQFSPINGQNNGLKSLVGISG